MKNKSFASLALPGLLLLISIASCFGELHWLLEMLSSFRLQYLLAFLLCTVGSLLGRLKNPVLYGVLATGLVLNGLELAPYYLPPSPPSPQHTTPLIWLQANVSSKNVGLQRLFEAIRQHRPDVVSLQEISERWKQQLSTDPFIQSAYPYRYFSSMFGQGLLSSRPLQAVHIETVFPQEPFNEIIVGDWVNQGARVHLMVIHPEHPTDGESAWQQQVVNDAIIRLQSARQTSGPNEALVIAGDFNTTPWSSQFHHVSGALGLRDANQGLGLLPSWPSAMPWPLRIPIDHILVSSTIGVQSCALLKSIGSDHLPVLCHLALP